VRKGFGAASKPKQSHSLTTAAQHRIRSLFNSSCNIMDFFTHSNPILHSFLTNIVDKWSLILFYTSVAGVIIQSLAYFTGLDIWSYYSNWRNSYYYYLDIEAMINSKIYNQTLNYLSNYPGLVSKMNYASVGKGMLDYDDYDEAEEHIMKAAHSVLANGKPFLLGPGFGCMSFMYEYQGKLYKMWVEHQKPERTGSKYNHSIQSISFTIAFKHKHVLLHLLHEASTKYKDALKDKVCLYTRSSGYSQSFQYAIKLPRPLDKIVLCQAAIDLITDAKYYFTPARKLFYERLGLPYRRGYLLYGPPGCGKSSFVLCLATETKKPIYYFNLNDKTLDDNDLQSIINLIPSGSIILFEDIDALFPKRKTEAAKESKDDSGANDDEDDSKDEEKPNVTLSGLLNSIDGIRAQEGSLIILTSNCPEKLDPALVRTGRVDSQVEFMLPDVQLATELAAKLFQFHHFKQLSSFQFDQDNSAQEVGDFARKIKDSDDITELMQLFMQIFHFKQYKNAIKKPFISFSDIQALFLRSHPVSCNCIHNYEDRISVDCVKKFLFELIQFLPTDFNVKKQLLQGQEKNSDKQNNTDSNEATNSELDPSNCENSKASETISVTL
jgi:hypothetical protein